MIMNTNLLHDLSDGSGDTRTCANLVSMHLLHVRAFHIHQEEIIGNLRDDGKGIHGPRVGDHSKTIVTSIPSHTLGVVDETINASVIKSGRNLINEEISIEPSELS